MNARTLTPTYKPTRIFSKVLLDPDNECWMWQGSKYENGYGKYGKAGFMAHRIVYEMLRGTIPEKMFLDHTCHTKDCMKGMKCEHRACVNPDHLEVVTKGENVLRGNSISAINAVKTHCIHGHKFTPKNTHTYRGFRICRTCKNERQKLYNQQQLMRKK